MIERRLLIALLVATILVHRVEQSVRAQAFDDAADEAPSGADADDDDDDGNSMDTSASNDYPDSGSEPNEGDDDDDSSYGDSDGSESHRQSQWQQQKQRNHRQEPLSRKRRDLDDSRLLARRASARRPAQGSRDDEDFGAVDDGDEDAWVHDGVDDIHIDPETKRAAVESAKDESSIDAEYEPHAASERDVVNRTRLTTISEVIPMVEEQDDSRISSRFARPPPARQASGGYMPAAHLDIDQVVELVGP